MILPFQNLFELLLSKPLCIPGPEMSTNKHGKTSGETAQKSDGKSPANSVEKSFLASQQKSK
jgi:hypothetical protein